MFVPTQTQVTVKGIAFIHGKDNQLMVYVYIERCIISTIFSPFISTTPTISTTLCVIAAGATRDL